MRRRILGSTGLNPSVLCLGTSRFGSAIPREDSFRILDAFAEAGGNFLDSAHIYAVWLPDGAGKSERTIGEWLRLRGVRETFVVGTKGGHLEWPEARRARLAPDEIAQDMNESLERLQTDAIDLYWLHRDDPAIPVGEILGALNEHLRAGRIRAIGCSNWSVARQMEAARYAEANGLTGFCASQIGWSLARRDPSTVSDKTMLYMDDATLEFHAQTRTPVVAYSSQANGFFSEDRIRGEGRAEESDAAMKLYGMPENLARRRRAQDLAARRGVSANQVALAFLLNHPFAVYPIIGPRTVAQVVESCAAHDLRLAPDEIAAL